MSQPPRDNRFLALRAAGQDAAEFELPDSGADAGAIAADLDVEREIADALVSADESYTVAHRIATGQERMYPVPTPEQRVVDARSGSSTVPIIVLIAVLVGVIVYGLLR